MTTTTLYRLIGADGTLLYIGIAGNPARRFQQHAQSKPWWTDIVTARLEHHPTRQAALTAERTAIAAEQPRFNVIHGTLTPAVAATFVRCPACDKPSAYVRRLDEFRHIDGTNYKRCAHSLVTGRVKATWSPPDWWWRAFPLSEEPEAPCPNCGEDAVWVPLIGQYVHFWFPRSEHGDALCWQAQAA